MRKPQEKACEPCRLAPAAKYGNVLHPFFFLHSDARSPLLGNLLRRMRRFSLRVSFLFGDALKGWLRHKAPKMGAALACYTIFSIAPMILFLLSFTSILFSMKEAQSYLAQALHDLGGAPMASAVQLLLTTAWPPHPGTPAALSATVSLLFGASGVFVELRDSLNTIWGVTERTQGPLLALIWDRAVSFAMVAVVGMLLLVAPLAVTTMDALSQPLSNAFPWYPAFYDIARVLTSFLAVVLLFAVLFRVLPQGPVSWKEAFFGGIGTALMFEVGRSGLGFFLSHSSIASLYGAVGSLLILLLWIYYSAQIFFLGAELTRAYAYRFGSGRATHRRHPT
ncbi:hypothetical protein MAMT_00299 [Methylacidimicrobium tartarophylax]|uniref:Uncharacterized protein n=2 Tax=Methylacidimicrobium tartarophylax TaxID=1041768 RepID=A0A5E6MH33_9BACT|nr:hypothetical protein MAMT_00299 [Methylacidimicrobium tartarophylax]